MPKGPTVRGAGLSREKVLEGALEIADAEGLEALSFRRLAAHFEVTPMALYRYVANKEALLDGLGDLVLSRLELPDSQAGDWREQLRAAAQSLRSQLVAHPATVPIFLSRPLFTPAGMRTADALLGLFRGAGFSTEQAVLRYQQVTRYLLALVMLETGSGHELTAEERRERSRVARITLESLPPEQFPHLVEAAPQLASPYDSEAAFDSGLDLLVAGLEHVLTTQAISTRPGRR
jgi:TetR/AcrR family transcriptional regulator, tetracycline repressor protein